MSDDPNAAASDAAGETGAADDKKPAAGASVSPGGTDDNPMLSVADPGDKGEGEADAPDWRVDTADGDEKELAWLNRFTTKKNYDKWARDARKRLSAGSQAASLPEDASEAEIAAYRKTTGIPEKAEGYGLAFPDTIAPTEAGAAVLNGFAAHMHAAHMPPAAAKTAFAFYTQQLVEAQEARAEFVRQAEAEARVELRAEWGGSREFGRTLTLGYEFLEKHLGDKAAVLAGKRLENGVPIGKDADFLRLIGAAARATADEDALYGGDGAGGGKSIDEELADLHVKGSRRTPAEEKRALHLTEVQLARDERQGRGRAA